jgi:carbon-monoxide dehydrogenase medium subunit
VLPFEKYRHPLSTDPMNIYSDISSPDSVQSLKAVLENAPANTRILAGGTDLLLELKQGIKPPAELVVDVSAIPEMLKLELKGSQIYIGAAVPLADVASSALIQDKATALYEACRLIGGPQVRNVATLGGNVGHALPAADGSIALLSLDAQADVLTSEGIVRSRLLDLYQGPGITALNPKDVILGFWVDAAGKNQASAFKRIMRPQGVALPILNVAIWLERLDDVIHSIRIAVGPGGPVPTRAAAAEEYLTGKKIEDEILQQAADLLLSGIKLRTSAMRATAAYRKHLCVQLFKDVLLEAWKRAA